MDAQNTIKVHGRIADTSDNWLPGVRVALRNAGVEGVTDGNGLFELQLSAGVLQERSRGGEIDFFEIDKDGYRGRSVAIKDSAWFAAFVEEALEPDPVAEDAVRFTIRMSATNSIHALPRRLGKEGDKEVSDSELGDALELVRSRPVTVQNDRASFYAVAPPGEDPLRAVFLISLHGMGAIDHPVLRDFSKRHRIALVGVDGAPVQRGCVPLSLLDPHLDRLGEMLGHPQLGQLPVFTFGHSNGTGFATVYATERPERLIAWISYHSGHGWQLRLPGVEKAPGLVMHGHLDKWLENGQEEAVTNLRSQRDAPVAMMIGGNVGHGPVDADATWEFIVRFCEAAMRIRLNPDGSLRPAVIEDGWLGGIYDRATGGQQTLPIAPHAEFTENRQVANWLPDAEFAKIWQAYGETDPRLRQAGGDGESGL